MHFIVHKATLVNVAILKSHFTVQALIIAPRPCESGSITPDHNALAITFARLELTFILSFLELDAAGAKDTERVFDGTVAAGPAIFEDATELIAVLKVDDTEII